MYSSLSVLTAFISVHFTNGEQCATLFDNGDFTDDTPWNIVEGNFSNIEEEKKDFDEEISSIQVMAGCELKGYSGLDFDTQVLQIASCYGTSKTSLVGTAENNKIKSVRCWCSLSLYCTMIYLGIAVPVVGVVLTMCAVLGIRVRKMKKREDEKETVDENPEYGKDDPKYYEIQNKIVDNNEYYD